MNIFFLDMIPKVCSQMHCNQHVVKMILEYAQILSSVHRVVDGEPTVIMSKNNRKMTKYKLNNELENILYKSTHINHPCVIWARKSILNYCWLYELFSNLCKEYTTRYKRIHLTDKKLRIVLKKIPNNLNGLHFTIFPQAMPDDVKNDNIITAYRDFYCKYKNFSTWKKTVPFWYSNKSKVSV